MTYVEQLFGYMGNLVAQRREQPTDDLLGALVKARDEGDRLTEQELLSIAGVGLLLTGVETVSTHIPNFVYALLTKPELMAQLRADRSLVPAAVEELLRMIPLNPAAMFPRYAVEDVELSAGTVRAGEPVLVSLPGANRDPEIFDNPETFDFTREQNPHVAFGHGPHHCLGAQLARMELQVALHTVLDRFPELTPGRRRRGRVVEVRPAGPGPEQADGGLVTAVDTRWTVTVDRDACIGTGVCAGAAPARSRSAPARRPPWPRRPRPTRPSSTPPTCARCPRSPCATPPPARCSRPRSERPPPRPVNPPVAARPP